MKKVFLGFLMAFGFFASAQNITKEVLFTIDDKPYYTDEFARVYKKNLDLVKDDSQKDLNQYLDLYIGYKLKVNKANKLGLQDKPQYQNELKSYRTQLAKNYTTDSKVTKELVEEGYQRLQKEINASHILIMVDENASPADTLAAYNKIMDIRQKAVSGTDFGQLAKDFSQDPSAKENQGNLGFFSAFRMVYAFETGSYNTPVGKVSMPIRTRFGYHLIRVNEIRPNRGEIAVAHIMILNPKEGEDPDKAKNTIQDIYKKIKQGEDFAELAKQFSEDKASAPKGGVLNRFGSGQLSSQEFEDAAFALTKEKEISEPFQSQFGWHIVKLIEKYPLKSLEESRKELENKVSKDDRSRLITNSLTEKLRKKYPIKKDKKTYEKVVKAVNDDFYEAKWTLPADTKPFDSKLFVIEKQTISGTDFLNYIDKQQKSGIKAKPVANLVEVLYSKFADEQLNQYYNDNLEKEFPEFSAVMDEYRDGLLLFDLMEKEIWDRSKNDTIGLKTFFETQKDKHVWKTRIDADVYTSTKEAMVKKAIEMLKKGSTPQQIKDKLNTVEVVNIMSYEGVYEEGAETLPPATKMQAGISDITKKGDYYYVINVKKVLPSGYKSLDECKGKVVNDYQQYLEQNWVNDLKKEFTVKINQDVFEKVKKQIKN